MAGGRPVGGFRWYESCRLVCGCGVGTSVNFDDRCRIGLSYCFHVADWCLLFLRGSWIWIFLDNLGIERLLIVVASGT